MVTRAPRSTRPSRHLLEVALGAAALGVVGVAPAEEDDVAAVERGRGVGHRRKRTGVTAGRVCRVLTPDPTRRCASVPGGDPAGRLASAPVPGVPLRAARPGPLLHRARRGLGRRSSRSTSTSPARSMLDVGGGPGYFRDAFRAGGRDVLRPRRRRRRAVRASGDIASGTVIGSGMQLPFADGSRRRLLLLQRARARPRPVADGRRDAAGHPARRPGLHQLHGLVRPVGRPRDRALALPRRPPGAPPVRRASTATSPRTSTASPCSRSPSRDGLRWARSQQHAEVRRTCCRATTRGGAAGCCRVPVVREVVTWNLVLVLRKQ